MPQPAARERFFDLLRSSLSDGSLSKLTLGRHCGPDASLKNIFARPVTLKGGPQLSFVYRHTTRDITKNYPPAGAIALLEKLIGGDFLDAHLFTAGETAQLSCDAGGEARLRIKKMDTRADARENPPHAAPAAHDNARNHLIPADAPWLRELGIMNDRARPREGMAAKFRQINKFAELLSHLAAEANLLAEPWRLPPGIAQAEVRAELETESRGGRRDGALALADMGCGKGYLTFAAAALFGEKARVQGIEARPELVSLCNRIAREQNFSNLVFTQGTIADAPLAVGALDILIALHACDTATDDAIARGIRAGARLIVVSPCCQKELRPQLAAPPVLAGALRHGIFQERQAEFATDALRALLLEHAGYRTKVFEFVSTEHTAKNLMIAAIKDPSAPGKAGDDAALQSLRDFARFYGIRKHALATQLGVELA